MAEADNYFAKVSAEAKSQAIKGPLSQIPNSRPQSSSSELAI